MEKGNPYTIVNSLQNFPKSKFHPHFQNAYNFYTKLKINEKMCYYTISVLGRYLLLHPTIKDIPALYASVLYIAIRHPYSYPNHETKADFVRRVKVKSKSMDWYIDALVSDLGFMKIHDNRHFPYYIDPKGIIHKVMQGVMEDALNEKTIKNFLAIPSKSRQRICIEVAGRLTRLKLIPEIFQDQLSELLFTII